MDQRAWSATALRTEHAFPPDAVGRRRHVRGAVRSSRQPLAALEPTIPQDRTPGPRAHALPEPVLLGTAQVVGLIGALHADLLDQALAPSATGASARRCGTGKRRTAPRRVPRRPDSGQRGLSAQATGAISPRATSSAREACASPTRSPARVFCAPSRGATVRRSRAGPGSPHLVDIAVDSERRPWRRCW